MGEQTAVVQDVPTTAFSEDALRRRLAKLEELEHCARAHHEVVTAASVYGAVVPLPLATLYRDDVRALAALSENTRRFGQALDRVEGHAEWAVKVHAVSRLEGNTSSRQSSAADNGISGRRIHGLVGPVPWFSTSGRQWQGLPESGARAPKGLGAAL